MKFFWCQASLFREFQFQKLTKNHASDSIKGSPRKIELRADGTHDSHPTAWELTYEPMIILNFFESHWKISYSFKFLYFQKFLLSQ